MADSHLVKNARDDLSANDGLLNFTKIIVELQA